MTTGYSGTPLALKLGLKSGMPVWFDAMPQAVRTEIDAEVEDIVPVASLMRVLLPHIFSPPSARCWSASCQS